jgi:ligand-binding SRPBCC domain-containing protein
MMSRIELETFIAAPRERCFDLSLSVDLHLDSTVHTKERVVSGPTGGLLGPDETITWEARHFGRTRRLTVQITGFDRPRWFCDEMVSGPLRRMRHDHRFEPGEGGTWMRDEFEFATLAPPFDRLVLARHFRRLLGLRNELIRKTAESDGWQRHLGPTDT